jgi:SpoVT / AbrB like domain.
MELARITSKGRMTIPEKVRDAAHLAVGDVVAFIPSATVRTPENLAQGRNRV